uniref:Uncharacterized protein n=1 Tax=Panagrolaimus sp. PS1159 TaxID=55785 RepID=A0AC35FZY0_9BILA
MEEKSSTRARRSTKNRETYSPSRFNIPITRQPRKSTNAESKSSPATAKLPSPHTSLPPPTPSTSSSSVDNNKSLQPSSSTSTSNANKNKNSALKIPPSKRTKSLLKLSKLPPKEEIFTPRETIPIKTEPPKVEPIKDNVIAPPPPPPQRQIPFDFSNIATQNLPDRRNKSKSVYQMGLLPRTTPIVRPSRHKRNQEQTLDKESSVLSTSPVVVKEEQPSPVKESSIEPSTSSTPATAFSSSKSPARRIKKSNPYSLLPASYKHEAAVPVIPLKADIPPPPSTTSDVPPPPQEAATFIPPPLPPPKPAPFDFKTVRRPRKQSIKKVSVSENDNSGGTMTAENIIIEGASAADSISIAGGEKNDNNTVLKIAKATIKSNVSGVKKKRRKRPLRLTMKKKKHSRTSFAAEIYDEEIVKEEGNEEEYDKADFDDDASEDEAIIEFELENYGDHSAKFLSNLHPDLQASFKHYENDDGSYFTRFVLYGNTFKEDIEKPSEDMAVDITEYPKYLDVFFNASTRIIDLCNDRLKETGALDVFPTERLHAKSALEILETKFNKENLCDIFIYGLSEIHKIILQSKTQNLPLPKMYIKCRDIATLIADSFISYPTELLFIFHRFFLTHLDVDALIVYMVLCRFVNQVFKISNVLKVFTAPHLNEINTLFVEIIKQNIVDPFREMIYKIDREFLTKDVVVVALVCNDVASDQYLSFQKLMLWFNTGFRKMGAIVESMTLSADWNNPELVEISAYNAIAMIQSYFKFIVETYPTSKLIVVNYGDPSMFFYHAIHFVERILGVINIAFPTSSYIDEVEHVRGGVEDTILNMTYCPSLFVIGEKAENSEISHYDQILKHYKSQQAGLIIVGDADDALTVSSKLLLSYGITPACIKRILLEHFADFIEKCTALEPLPSKTYFPCANYSNDPDFELYNVVKEEVTTMHMKLFEQTKNYYDIRADLTQKRNKSAKNDATKISPNGLSKEEIEGDIQSMNTEYTMENFSKALMNLKFS